MEKKLARMFDYQKFEGGAKLSAVIAETENRLCMLNDDALSMVAGGCWYENDMKKEENEMK